MNFSWTFPGFDILQICMIIGLSDSHRHRFRAVEVTIYFPCHSIAHYFICFRQLPRRRISTSAMPTQTRPRRAPPAGTAAAKKRSTAATPTSARDVAAAGAICWDGRSEEDIHNGDDSERGRRRRRGWTCCPPGRGCGRRESRRRVRRGAVRSDQPPALDRRRP